MKKTFITVALFAVLGTMAESCQKENIVNPMASETSVSETYQIAYSVDGVNMVASLNGDDELMAFLQSLTALAREGHRVTVCNSITANQSQAKEKVVFRTGSEEEANEWALKMIKDGYSVTIEFDETSGEFVCTAIK